MKVAQRHGLLLLGGISLASLICVWAGCSESPSPSSLASLDRHGIYISKVAKSSQVPFYNRFARQESHVVVTSAPVSDAIESVHLALTSGEDVAFIETPETSGGKVPGEIYNVAGIRVVKPPLDSDLHQYGGVSQHAGEYLARELTYAGLSNVTTQLQEATVTRAQLPNITRQNLETRLRQLSGDIPVDIAGAVKNIAERRVDGNKVLVRSWLAQEYEKLGYVTSLDVYGSGALGTNANFVAEKTGKDPDRYVLVTSHLDSVGNPGADDNGAGTISALAVAEALASVDLNYSIKYVAFDQEELGLVGSKAYAKRHDLKGLIGVINVEMTSFDSDNDGAIHVIDCNENQSPRITNIFNQLIQDATRRLKVVAACTNRSDHASFWRYNKPAVIISQNFFGGDDNPCYHRGCDRVDRVNYDYMVRVTNLLKDATYSMGMGGI